MFSLMPWRRKEGNGNKGETTLWEREYPVSRLREQFEDMFRQFFGRLPKLREAERWFGESFRGLNMEETDKEVVVRAEAPGFEAEDFDVHVFGNLLTIKAEHKQETEEKKDKYYYAEKRVGRFQRSVRLPPGLLPDRISARYHSGVLEVHVPRSAEAVTKRIEVKT